MELGSSSETSESASSSDIVTLTGSTSESCSITSPSFSSLSGSSDDNGGCCGTNTTSLPAFKIVGDNIDKYVKPREMRLDAQSKSMHYFNFYAVKSRVDVSKLPDEPCLPDFASFDLKITKNYHSVILTNFKIHIASV